MARSRIGVILALVAALALPGSAAARGNPFANRGMWIWYVSASSGGSVNSIIATAKAYGVSTLFIKAGDGSSAWSQFNRSLVSTLHAHGIKACAWQYVYGNNPVAEANVGAAAVHAGADCLAIDAEAEYQGKYISAQTYITRLRQLVGRWYPLSLAGFPYVDYHPGFPYSVFLGPGGAQYNTPQMYWRDIGTTVDTVYSHTYAYNRIYARQIDPLGQVYQSPPAAQIVRFRSESRSYGAPGVSWWDWQEASSSGWRAVAKPAGFIAGFTPSSALAVIGQGAKGDAVVEAQERLITAGYAIPVDGDFGPSTTAAVQQFQTAGGLTADGVLGPATWQALLRYPAAKVTWTKRGATVARAAGGLVKPVPKSAALPGRNELRRSLGSH